MHTNFADLVPPPAGLDGSLLSPLDPPAVVDFLTASSTQVRGDA